MLFCSAFVWAFAEFLLSSALIQSLLQCYSTIQCMGQCYTILPIINHIGEDITDFGPDTYEHHNTIILIDGI